MALANFMRLSLMKAAHVDLSDMAKQEFGYASVGMTNLFGGTGLKASAHRVHSMLNLPTGESAAPNEQNGWAWIWELTRGALVWGKGAQQIPPLRSPEFLLKLMALANFMRLSLMKAAHVDLSDMAKQEFGYATVGMTNLFGEHDGKFA